jgi:hypothetical protein
MKNVKSTWIDGDLVFMNAAGLEIFRIDGDNCAMIFAATGNLALPPDAISTDAFIADKTITGAKLDDKTVTGGKIADDTITAAKLANGAGLGALVAAGLGVSANYDKATDGAQDLSAVNPVARACICVVIVTEAFDNGTGGTQTEFTIGDESSATCIMTADKLTGAALGSVFVFAGQITAGEKLVVTATKAGGDGTGAISVTALLLEES